MYNKLIKFIKPSVAISLVFALIAAFCLIQQYQYVQPTNDAICPISLKDQVNIGFPFVYYIYKGEQSELSLLNLFFNLSLLYLLACVLVSIASTVFSIFKTGKKSKQVAAASILINAVLATFIVLAVFGENMLINAVKNQNYVTARLLTTVGIAADTLSPNKEAFALYEAAKNSNIDLITLLLGSGANAQLTNKKGYTALHRAVQSNSVTIVSKLLLAGANINTQDHYAKTALHYACNFKMVKLLVNKGANTHAKDNHGNLASFYIKDQSALTFLASYKPSKPKGKNQTNTSPNNHKKSHKKNHESINANNKPISKHLELIAMVKNKNQLNDIIKIVDSGASILKNDFTGKNSLYYALSSCSIPIGQFLYKKSDFSQHATANSINVKLKELIKHKSICWERITNLSDRKVIEQPIKSISCKTKIDGNLIYKGKKQAILEVIDDKKYIYKNSYAFLYANCAAKGYIHILIDGNKDYRKIISNLIANKKDLEGPLLIKENDVALLSFKMPEGNAIIKWYFSIKPTDNLIQDIKQGKIKKILFEKVHIKSLD